MRVSSPLGVRPRIRDPRCPAAGPIASPRPRRAPGSRGAPGAARGRILTPPPNFASCRALLLPAQPSALLSQFWVRFGEKPPSFGAFHPVFTSSSSCEGGPGTHSPLGHAEKFGAGPKEGGTAALGAGGGGPGAVGEMSRRVPAFHRGRKAGEAAAFPAENPR